MFMINLQIRKGQTIERAGCIIQQRLSVTHISKDDFVLLNWGMDIFGYIKIVPQQCICKIIKDVIIFVPMGLVGQKNVTVIPILLNIQMDIWAAPVWQIQP